MARLAISKDYFPAYARLPRKAQRKADEFLVKFQRDSTSAAIHLEPLHRMVDAQMRSARIGDDYRIILRAPEAGDVFLVLYADHHDEAYRWAATKQAAVHPATGSLQIFDAELAARALTAPLPSVEPAPVPAPASHEALESKPTVDAPELFAQLTDDELFVAGVPRPLLPSVRSVATEDELDLLLPHLPPEAGEVLTGVAAGLSLDQALEEVLGRTAPPSGARPEPQVDVADVAAALERETTQRQFRLFDDSIDLDAALKHPLDVWRVYLHPRQRRLAHARTKGPVRLLGGAGTGKTVVALHRAAFLVRTVFTKPDDRVLFTTFTVNLALDLRAQLAKLLEPDQLARVEVTNLDRWATEYLRGRGQPVRVAYEKEQHELFRGAYEVYGPESHTLDFCRAEWREVVQDQGLTSEQAYVLAVRKHRGVPLSRAERRSLWPVFAAYRDALEQAGFVEPLDVLRRARLELEGVAAPPRYQSVVVDEVQDFSADALRLVRAIAGPERPDDLFLVGDAHQRIYGRPIPLSSCGIQVRGRRSQTLRLNYRTTGAICRWSLRTLADLEVDDLDDGKADRRGYVSLREGMAPVVRVASTQLDEERAVTDIVKDCLERGVPSEGICVVARTRSLLVDRFGAALERAAIDSVLLDQDEPRRPGVRLATMHRVKGLEFAVVVIAGASKDYLPYPSTELRSEDPVVAEQAMLRERCLLYVAASRARDELYVTAAGQPSTLLGRLEAGASTTIRPERPRSVRPEAAQPEVAAGRPAAEPRETAAATPLAIPLESLSLPTRLFTWAERSGVTTLGELAARSPQSLLAEKNLGRTTIAQARNLIESLLGRSWEELAAEGAPASPPLETAPTGPEAMGAAAAPVLGPWDRLRAALTEEQRVVPLELIELPARVRSYAQRESLVTLGDLATRSFAVLQASANFGRKSVSELAPAIDAHFARAESERAIAALGICEGFKTLIQQQDPMLRIIMTRRSGLGGEAQTLQVLGDTFGVSRERIRQLEARVAAGLRRREFAGETARRVSAALAEGARPLGEIALDPWWSGAEARSEVVGYVVDDILGLAAHVFEWDGEPWLGPEKRAAVEHAWDALETAAGRVRLPAPFSAFEPALARARKSVGDRLAERFRQQLKERLQFDGSFADERVVAIGDSRRAEALGILRASPTPMNVDELYRRVGSRLHFTDEFLYFGPRTVGVEQHFPEFARWRSLLVPAARALIESTAPDRQWTCSELLEELREEHELPEWLNAFCLGSLVRGSPELVYLGRLRVALPAGEESQTRVFIHEAVEKILREAGAPVSKDELFAKLRARLGASPLTLQALLAKPGFVRVDDDRVGLLDRDVPGGAEAIAEALDQLEAILDRRGRGLSSHHASAEVRQLSLPHEAWTEALMMSLVRGDGRFRTSRSGAIGLSAWESTRVPTRQELLRAALDEASGRVSVEAVCDRIEAYFGDRPTRGTLGGMAAASGASLDGGWIVPKSN